MSGLPFPLNNPAFNGGLINYLKVRHFQGKLSKDIVFSLLNRLEGDQPDSLSASSLALGLFGSPNTSEAANELSISSRTGQLPLEGKTIHVANVPPGSGELTFAGAPQEHFFFGLVESGFDSLACAPR